MTKPTTKRTRKITNNTRANCVAVPATPQNPNAPATIATTKNGMPMRAWCLPPFGCDCAEISKENRLSSPRVLKMYFATSGPTCDVAKAGAYDPKKLQRGGETLLPCWSARIYRFMFWPKRRLGPWTPIRHQDLVEFADRGANLR
jgi:hypothetical protein